MMALAQSDAGVQPVEGAHAARIRSLALERGLSFFESFSGHSEKPVRALFFYHCPKTGGMTVTYALEYALSCLPSVQEQDLFLGRIDRMDTWPGHRYAMPCAFVATHLPYEAHAAIAQDFDLFTVVRDPVGRVTSEYTYECMRHGEKPRPDAFAAFFRAPQITNVMVRQLSGFEPGKAMGGANLRLALDHLSEHFACYVANDRIAELVSGYLSLFRAPNVLMQNANQTLPEYRIDSAPFAAEIRDLNALDAALFEYVRQSPRLLNIPRTDESVSPMTVFIDEVERRSATVAHAYHHETTLVPALLRSGLEGLRKTTWVQAAGS